MSSTKYGLGIKAAQVLPATRIDKDNLVESVQKLYDLLGAAKLGRESENSVYVCGVLLRDTEDLEERIEELENGGLEDG